MRRAVTFLGLSVALAILATLGGASSAHAVRPLAIRLVNCAPGEAVMTGVTIELSLVRQGTPEPLDYMSEVTDGDGDVIFDDFDPGEPADGDVAVLSIQGPAGTCTRKFKWQISGPPPPCDSETSIEGAWVLGDALLMLCPSSCFNGGTESWWRVRYKPDHL